MVQSLLTSLRNCTDPKTVWVTFFGYLCSLININSHSRVSVEALGKPCVLQVYRLIWRCSLKKKRHPLQLIYVTGERKLQNSNNVTNHVLHIWAFSLCFFKFREGFRKSKGDSVSVTEISKCSGLPM